MKKGTCVHFNGIRNAVCKAGVNYRQHVGGPDLGWVLRLPCILDPLRKMTPEQAAETEKRVPCDQYQDATPEQIAERKQAIRSLIDKMALIMPLVGQVKRDHKGENWRGVRPCPVCKGRLHLSHSARNGHVWGKCETKGCVSWME